jgi:hypothetical protein
MPCPLAPDGLESLFRCRYAPAGDPGTCYSMASTSRRLRVGKFKNWVVREFERQRLGSSSGMLSRAEMLEVYRMAVEEVIHSWARGFQTLRLERARPDLYKVARPLGLWSAAPDWF